MKGNLHKKGVIKLKKEKIVVPEEENKLDEGSQKSAGLLEATDESSFEEDNEFIAGFMKVNASETAIRGFLNNMEDTEAIIML